MLTELIQLFARYPRIWTNYSLTLSANDTEFSELQPIRSTKI
ncbi:hypothetical protein BH20ACI2_BH20ACI2_20600 [soil metagenome]